MAKMLIFSLLVRIFSRFTFDSFGPALNRKAIAVQECSRGNFRQIHLSLVQDPGKNLMQSTKA